MRPANTQRSLAARDRRERWRNVTRTRLDAQARCRRQRIVPMRQTGHPARAFTQAAFALRAVKQWALPSIIPRALSWFRICETEPSSL